MAAAASVVAAAARLVRPSTPSSSSSTRTLLSAVRLPSGSLRGFAPLAHAPAPRFARTTVASSFPSLSTATVSSTIAVGDKLPDATLSYFDPAGDLQTVTVSQLTNGKKAVFFAVPGAFTPTCSQKHLPGFVDKAGDLRAKGVDTIACVSVNDAFVMRAWKENLTIGDEVLLLSDGNREFTRALGVELDLSEKPVGLGVRSRRYALFADDGVVKVLNLEEGGAFTVSSAEDILKAL